MAIKINDKVKEIRTNKIGIVKDINKTKTFTRYLLDFPDNSFGWFGIKELSYNLDEIIIDKGTHTLIINK